VTQRWQENDFRASRKLLDPEVFLNGSNPPPSDLVDKQIWEGIMNLPDHVSITTSNHQGKSLKVLHEVWSAWIEAVGDVQDRLYDTILDACDEFQITIFNALHGYYRPAIGCLRNALELIVFGAYTQACSKASELTDSPTGKIRFSHACDFLSRSTAIQPLNKYLRSILNDSLFEQSTETISGGWARRLHSDLSNFSHSRPSFSNVDIWQSNGPIYIHEAFVRTVEMYLQTSALCFLVVKLGKPNFVLPPEAMQVFQTTDRPWSNLARQTFQYLFIFN
jgi:hypothetical protein